MGSVFFRWLSEFRRTYRFHSHGKHIVLNGNYSFNITTLPVRFQVLTTASKKFRVFCDVTPCIHVDFGRLFIGAYCLHRQGDFNVTTQPCIPEDPKLERCPVRSSSLCESSFLIDVSDC
jgi:hypothetical protein